MYSGDLSNVQDSKPLVNKDPYNGLNINPYKPGWDFIPCTTQPTRVLISFEDAWRKENSSAATPMEVSPKLKRPSEADEKC